MCTTALQVYNFHTANWENRQFVLEESDLRPAVRHAGLRFFTAETTAWGSTVRVSYYLVYNQPEVEEVS